MYMRFSNDEYIRGDILLRGHLPPQVNIARNTASSGTREIFIGPPPPNALDSRKKSLLIFVLEND